MLLVLNLRVFICHCFQLIPIGLTLFLGGVHNVELKILQLSVNGVFRLRVEMHLLRDVFQILVTEVVGSLARHEVVGVGEPIRRGRELRLVCTEVGGQGRVECLSILKVLLTVMLSLNIGQSSVIVDVLVVLEV